MWMAENNRPQVLNASTSTICIPSEPLLGGETVAHGEGESLSHRDERQIMLDTDRSFVHYPSGEAPSLVPARSNARWTSRNAHTVLKGRATQPRKK